MKFIDMFAGIGGFRSGLEKAGISNTQLYKQAGNAVTVDVIEQIGKRLVLEDDETMITDVLEKNYEKD